MRLLAVAAALLLLMGCATTMDPEPDLDQIAEDYVRMTLEMGEREAGYVDAYYGPDEWQEAARNSPRTVSELRTEVARLRTALETLVGLGQMERRRRDFLLAQLEAASTRMRMAQGEKLSFVEEAGGLFGVRPDLKPLSAYDPVLARIEKLVPGEGPLWSRVDRFRDRFIVPQVKLDAVMRTAIDECRRRTEQYISLPAEEKFTLEFVTGKSWSGYNWYKGNATSLIQINTDLPVRISRAVDLGCHEGYPGHHVFNTLLEERLRFETEVLYPLAGLPAGDAARYLHLEEAMSDLAGARFTIAADYLEGRIDRARAVELTQQYQLVSRERAEQSMDFVDQYRSYVINYGLGEDLVAAYVKAGGADPAARWALMEKVISEPTLPRDLVRR